MNAPTIIDKAPTSLYLDRIEPKRIFDFAKYFVTASIIFAFGLGLIKFAVGQDDPIGSGFLSIAYQYLELFLIMATGLLLILIGFYLFFKCTIYGCKAIYQNAETIPGKLFFFCIALVYLVIVITVLVSAFRYYAATNDKLFVDGSLGKSLNQKEAELVDKYSLGVNDALNALYETEIKTRQVGGAIDKANQDLSLLIGLATGTRDKLGLLSVHLQKISERERIEQAINRSEPILFAYDSDDYDKENEARLNHLAKVISAAKEYTFLLQGRASAEGSWQYNNDLGLRRARQVKKQLMANGIDEERLILSSIGKRDYSEKTADTLRSVRVILHTYNPPLAAKLSASIDEPLAASGNQAGISGRALNFTNTENQDGGSE